jgi:hypothetical protein
MDKSSVLNHSRFYFKTKAIKLNLKTVPIFNLLNQKFPEKNQ